MIKRNKAIRKFNNSIRNFNRYFEFLKKSNGIYDYYSNKIELVNKYNLDLNEINYDSLNPVHKKLYKSLMVYSHISIYNFLKFSTEEYEMESFSGLLSVTISNMERALSVLR